MDVKLWSSLPSGGKRVFSNVPAPVADRMFEAHAKILRNPHVTYYRVTLEDPLRGGYVVRDTDGDTLELGGATRQ